MTSRLLSGLLGCEPRLKIRELEHFVVSETAGQVQALLLLQLLNSGCKRLPQGLLVLFGVRDPKNVVVFIGIEVPDVSRNDVLLVTGWILEREFALDCDSAAFGVEGC